MINTGIREHQAIIDELREERKPIQEQLDRIKRGERADNRKMSADLDLALMKEYVRGASIKQIAERHSRSPITVQNRILKAWRTQFRSHWLATYEKWGAVGLTTMRNSPPIM